MKPKFRIRLVEPGDHAYIHHAWWKTMRPRYPFTDGQLLKQAISFHVEQSLKAGLGENLIACDEQDDSTIYSVLMCHQITPTMVAIDFGYTRNSMRRMGFQNSLLFTLKDYRNKVVTMQAPCFSQTEYYSASGEPFGRVLNEKGIVIDPFLYERLSLAGYGER